jgi:hypothetical protein
VNADVITDLSANDTIHLIGGSAPTLAHGAFDANGYAELGSQSTNFSALLDSALAAFTPGGSGGKEVVFGWTATNGYLLIDNEGDGDLDQVVVLVGIDNTEIDSSMIDPGP